jgi:copper chaperone CopZ
MMKIFDEPLQELDLVVFDLQSQTDEERIQKALKRIPGVQAARIIPEGVWIRYEAKRVTKDKIFRSLLDAGFSPRFFQDSLTGQTAEVSQR